jgi:hypothetical protein
VSLHCCCWWRGRCSHLVQVTAGLVGQLVAVAGRVQLPQLAAMCLHHPQLNIVVVWRKTLQQDTGTGCFNRI